MLVLPEFAKDLTFEHYNKPFLIMTELYGKPADALIMRRIKKERYADPKDKDSHTLSEFSINFILNIKKKL